ncbi:MAG: hypothetical protein GY835_03430 [bacterium]|nr:hypothetical protein [bacterium]
MAKKRKRGTLQRRSTGKSGVLALLLGAFALMMPGGIAEGDGIPPIIYPNWDDIDRTYPRWVSAEAAIAPSGELNRDLFHPQNLILLDDFFATPIDPDLGCIPVAEEFVSWVNPPDRSTLHKAIQTSELVFVGEIVDRDFGFDHGIPGQMLGVVPREVLKGESLQEHYFFLPIGNLSVGRFKICKTDSRCPPKLPVVGDEVLLMVPRIHDPREPLLWLVYPESIIVLKEDGSISLPDRFRLQESESASSSEPVGRTELIGMARTAAGKGD